MDLVNSEVERQGSLKRKAESRCKIFLKLPFLDIPVYTLNTGISKVSLDSELTVPYMFLCIEVWPKNERLSGIDADTCETRALCYSEISCLTQTYTSCDRYFGLACTVKSKNLFALLPTYNLFKNLAFAVLVGYTKDIFWLFFLMGKPQE